MQPETFAFDTPDGFPYEATVYTPWHYSADAAPYACLFVLDPLIAAATAYESALLQSMSGEIDPLFIVGVGPAADLGPETWQTRRLRDLTVTHLRLDTAVGKVMADRVTAAGSTLQDSFGGAAEFLGFLTDTVLPKVCNQYAIDTERLGLLGHSCGGSFGAYALLHNAPFSSYALGSFVLDFAGEDVEDKTAAFLQQTRTRAPRVFTGVGSLEAPLMAASGRLLGQDWLRSLADAGAIQLQSRVFEDVSHTSVVPGFIASALATLYSTQSTYADALLQTTGA